MYERRSKRPETTQIAGMPVAAVSENDLVSLMVEDCCLRHNEHAGSPVFVADINGQAISMQAAQPDYATAMADADLIHADGQFIVWLSRILPGASIPERTATTDLIHSFAEAAEQNQLKFYLLGGTEDINRRCADELQRQYPRLEICGRRNGYFEPTEEASILEDINASKADILWVGLGKPKEQQFCLRNRDKLNCAWMVTCGGCFNFVAGDYRRAPGWMQRAGLEWLHRMFTGPRYLIRRYLVTIPHALAIVFKRDVLGWRGRKSQK